MLKLLAGGLLGSVGDLWTKIFGDKGAMQAAAADDMAALRVQYAAEATGPERLGLWNSMVDGLNRLVRPLFTFGTLALFIWAVRDPIDFAVARTALQAVPEALWIIMGSIVVFWFGGRALEGMKAPIMSVGAMRELVRTLDEMRRIEKPSVPLTEERYQAEMADDGKPLSDAAIAEWNRRSKG